MRVDYQISLLSTFGAILVGFAVALLLELLPTLRAYLATIFWFSFVPGLILLGCAVIIARQENEETMAKTLQHPVGGLIGMIVFAVGFAASAWYYFGSPATPKSPEGPHMTDAPKPSSGGGPGGSVKVIGNNNVVRSGDGGRDFGGARGGSGGDLEISGDNNLGLAGRGGDSGHLDGRGGDGAPSIDFQDAFKSLFFGAKVPPLLLIEKLRAEYFSSNFQSEKNDGSKILDDWINQKLQELGEPWKITSVPGGGTQILPRN